MANICFTSLSIQKDDTCKSPAFTSNEQEEALRKDVEAEVTYDRGTDFHYTSEDLIECDIATRWNVPIEPLKKIAKTHDVKIRAVGREDAVGFVQVVCIDSSGKVVQDNEIGYSF